MEAIYPTTFANGRWTAPLHPWHFRTHGDECPVCKTADPAHTISTTCGHVYHWSCLFDWFKSLMDVTRFSQFTCPMCRRVLVVLPPEGVEDGDVEGEETDVDDEQTEVDDEQTEVDDDEYVDDGGEYEEEEEEEEDSALEYSEEEAEDEEDEPFRRRVEAELQYRQDRLLNLYGMLREEAGVPDLGLPDLGLLPGGTETMEELAWRRASGTLELDSNADERVLRVRRWNWRTKVQIKDTVERIEKLQRMIASWDA